jgi:hypothetical protein
MRARKGSTSVHSASLGTRSFQVISSGANHWRVSSRTLLLHFLGVPRADWGLREGTPLFDKFIEL